MYGRRRNKIDLLLSVDQSWTWEKRGAFRICELWTEYGGSKRFVFISGILAVTISTIPVTSLELRTSSSTCWKS